MSASGKAAFIAFCEQHDVTFARKVRFSLSLSDLKRSVHPNFGLQNETRRRKFVSNALI